MEASADNMGITYDSNVEWYMYVLNFVIIGWFKIMEPLRMIRCLITQFFLQDGK
jgi:hypothetical protein